MHPANRHPVIDHPRRGIVALGRQGVGLVGVQRVRMAGRCQREQAPGVAGRVFGEHVNVHRYRGRDFEHEAVPGGNGSACDEFGAAVVGIDPVQGVVEPILRRPLQDDEHGEKQDQRGARDPPKPVGRTLAGLGECLGELLRSRIPLGRILGCRRPDAVLELLQRIEAFLDGRRRPGNQALQQAP